MLSYLVASLSVYVAGAGLSWTRYYWGWVTHGVVLGALEKLNRQYQSEIAFYLLTKG